MGLSVVVLCDLCESGCAVVRISARRVRDEVSLYKRYDNEMKAAFKSSSSSHSPADPRRATNSNERLITVVVDERALLAACSPFRPAFVRSPRQPRVEIRPPSASVTPAETRQGPARPCRVPAGRVGPMRGLIKPREVNGRLPPALGGCVRGGQPGLFGKHIRPLSSGCGTGTRANGLGFTGLGQ